MEAGARGPFGQALAPSLRTEQPKTFWKLFVRRNVAQQKKGPLRYRASQRARLGDARADSEPQAQAARKGTESTFRLSP